MQSWVKANAGLSVKLGVGLDVGLGTDKIAELFGGLGQMQG